MTYIELVNRFWELNQVKTFSSIEVAVYFSLLNECNIRRWLNPFELRTRYLEYCFEISRKSIGEARNRLKQRNLIDFIEGKGKRPSLYLIKGAKVTNKELVVTFNVSTGNNKSNNIGNNTGNNSVTTEVTTRQFSPINNIKTKKGRTFLTSFAASIGIIGIALILSLSNGFQIKIDEYEEDTLSQMPITISTQAMDVDEEAMQQMIEGNKEHKEYSNKKIIYPRDNSLETMMHINNLDSEYIDYIESMNKDNVNAISYQYGTTLNVVTEMSDGTYKTVPTSTNYSMSTTSMTGVMGWNLYADKVNGKSMLEDNYDVLAGNIDKDTPGIVIAVNSRNELDSSTLEQLGFNTSDNISFEDILNKEFKVIPNDVYYDEINNYFVPSKDYEEMYNSEDAITIKVNAIIRGKEDKSTITQSGIYYNSALVDEVIYKNKDSEIVTKQK